MDGRAEAGDPARGQHVQVEDPAACQSGHVYHILPRPDDKVWDGIEYFDPAAKTGAVYVFRPNSPEDRETIKLKGLDAKTRYWLWCEDGSIAPLQKTGDELMRQGFDMRLPNPFPATLSSSRTSCWANPPTFRLRTCKRPRGNEREDHFIGMQGTRRNITGPSRPDGNSASSFFHSRQLVKVRRPVGLG